MAQRFMELASFTDKLVRDLDDSYSSVAPFDTLRYIGLIEERIARELKEAIVLNMQSLDPRVRRSEAHGFIFQGGSFEIIVGYRDIMKESTVAVVLAEVAPPVEPIVEHLTLRGNGKFKKADVIISPRLSTFVQIVCTLTKGFYETGYSWLNEFLRVKSQGLESSMTTQLFRQIRIAFAGQPMLADMVWLFVTDDKQGIYCFDQHATEQTITRINKLRGSIGQSPAEMFLSLLTTQVPYEQIFSRHAIESGETLRMDFTKVEYLESEPLVALAEYVLHKSTIERSQVATVFPIVRDKPPYLLAVFPTANEDEIVSGLRAHLLQIQTTFSEQKSYAQSLVKRMKDMSGSNLPVGQVGEFVGAVIKGLTGS